MSAFRDVISHLRNLTDGGVSDAELLRRYAEARDEAAFELLVWRHGALVLNTCRRILGPRPDAEDAFQATFLALARKAGTVRDGRALPGWLYHVARRAALRARDSARRHERPALPADAATTPPEPGFEVAGVLEEEVARLPEPMRLAFVLCQLDGLTAAEAAARLGCPEGTILSRLSRARQRLRNALTRRGLAPEPAIPRSSVPAALVAATLRGGNGAVLSLTQGVLRDMALTKLKHAAALAALVLVAGLGGAMMWQLKGAAPPEADPPPRVVRLATAEQGLKQVEEAAFSPDGRWLATAGSKPAGTTFKSALVVWDVKTGKAVHVARRSPGYGVTFSPDGKQIAAADAEDGLVELMEVETWKRRVLGKHPMAGDLAFGPDGKTLTTRSLGFAGPRTISEVRLWDVAAGKQRLNLKREFDEEFHSLAYSPDGKTLAVGSSTGLVRCVETATGKELTPLRAARKGAVEAVYAPDGRSLVTCGWRGRSAVVWDAASGAPLRRLAPGHPVEQLAFSPDGRTLVAAGRERITLMNPSTGRAGYSAPAFGLPIRLTFSPGGTILAATGAGDPDQVHTTLLIWPRRSTASRLERTKAVEFAPRGGRVVVVVEGDERRPDEVTLRDAAGLGEPRP